MNKPFTIAAVLLCLSARPPGAKQAGSGASRSDRTAPFDNDLQRLAEILGALHYLRPVCGAHDGQKWRNEMQALLDAEAPSGERRRKIVASFNRGYRGFQQTYRTCTPAASSRSAAISRKAPDRPRHRRALRQLAADYGAASKPAPRLTFLQDVTGPGVQAAC